MYIHWQCQLGKLTRPLQTADFWVSCERGPGADVSCVDWRRGVIARAGLTWAARGRMKEAGTIWRSARCSQRWRVLCYVTGARCWGDVVFVDIWLSPFCTTPIRQALTLNGETALLHAGAFGASS